MRSAILAATAIPGASAPVVPDEDVDVTTRGAVNLDRPWDVVVWDDPVTLMSYVVWVFKRVLGVAEPVATSLMLQVHNEGRALVASKPREQAELLLQRLLAHGLSATMQRAG